MLREPARSELRAALTGSALLNGELPKRRRASAFHVKHQNRPGGTHPTIGQPTLESFN
jgi:hypothetical protein